MILKRFSEYIKIQKQILNLSIGQITLLKQIGQGGNGVVYSASVQGHQVAIKFLLTETRGKTLDNKKTRFIAEYFNVATLKKKAGIVQYIDFDVFKFCDDHGEVEIPIIIMKLYDSSLATMKIGDPEQIKGVFSFLLETVETIHSQGVIHRDIKPENILLSNNSYVLADFGIANYNPEIFELRAKTEKNERVGNRLFSAPEQEIAGIEPHPTMDIYAIGQVIQWLATSETHRGTNRRRLTSIHPDLEDIDIIIEKCLSHNSNNRYQTIEEIKDDLSKKKKRTVNIWRYMEKFTQILIRNFPKIENGFVHCTNAARIDKLFQDLNNNEDYFEDYLWWQDGIGNIDFKLRRKGEKTWKFDDDEYTIKEIWIHYDHSVYNDFIILHYEKGEPFIINDEESYYAIVVDDKYYITYSEYQNGYAEIDDKIIDLEHHKVELTHRKDEEGYFIIAPCFNCALVQENDTKVIDFLKLLKLHNGQLDIKEFKKFEWDLREHKDLRVLMHL